MASYAATYMRSSVDATAQQNHPAVRPRISLNRRSSCSTYEHEDADKPLPRKKWYKHVNWLNILFIAVIPFIGCVASLSTPLRLKTLCWSIIYYHLTGLGITAGYHRLWAHNSYKAALPLKIFLAGTGAGAVQGSIRWWARNHRAHHRYTDTDKDPYSVKKGLLYSHLGWMVIKQDPKQGSQ